MPIENLIEFVLYLVPGFLALELYRSVYPAQERNQFAQITWSILLGVVIYSFTKWIDKNLLKYALCSNSIGFPAFRFIIALLIVGLLVGAARILFRFLRFKLSTKFDCLKLLAPDPQSIWNKINQIPDNEWAVVFLNDGSIYLGYISSYTFNPHYENQDFLLTKAKRVDENLITKYIVDGKGVYLNTNDIIKIEFVKGST